MAVELHDYDHVFTCIPQVYPNTEGHRITVQMKAVPQVDIEAQARVEAVLDVEARGKKAVEFIGSKVVDINCDCELCGADKPGVKVGARYISTYEEARKVPQLNELVKWMTLSVYAPRYLTEAEAKN